MQRSDSFTRHPRELSWPFWFLVPLYPYRTRQTLRREVVPGTIWAFDQLQGILYTVIPIRMIVVKLQTGGLLIYAPVAPTPQCLRLLNELVAQHGEVKYILSPTSSGLEHKVFVGPFARYFPNAQVYVIPHQWSYPFNLPLPWLGFPQERTHILPTHPADSPLADEFDYAILDIDLGQGAYGDLALLHKASGTLLVVDSVMAVPEEPPEIIQLDPYPLLFHARENALEPMVDTPANRRKGWQRIALFAFFLKPHAIETVGLQQAWQEAIQAPDRSKRAYFGFYPFRWRPDWQESFMALRGQGRPFVAPVLQTFILNQAPTVTLAWADTVAKWEFQHIMSCHFEAIIPAAPAEFRAAFAFLEKHPLQSPTKPLPEADFEFLTTIEARLTRSGITKPSQEKV